VNRGVPSLESLIDLAVMESRMNLLKAKCGVSSAVR